MTTDLARIPYPVTAANHGVDAGAWQTLVNAIYPSAKTSEGVLLALSYCKSRGLDPFKRPVHIVPMSTRRAGPDGRDVWQTVETVWPGISELRLTAHRTGVYAGCDPAQFGPVVRHEFDVGEDDGGHPNAPKGGPTPRRRTLAVEFPQWCQVTVYRLVKGARVAFPGPRVYWLESYATQGKTRVPNEMWRTRASGQLEKCAEAAALRKAFPEELGGEYTVDEAPRMVDVTPTTPAPRPDRVEIERPPAPPAPSAQEAAPAMSEALEHAIDALEKMRSAEEIGGARKVMRQELTGPEYVVWNTAAIERERGMKRS